MSDMTLVLFEQNTVADVLKNIQIKYTVSFLRLDVALIPIFTWIPVNVDTILYFLQILCLYRQICVCFFIAKMLLE